MQSVLYLAVYLIAFEPIPSAATKTARVLITGANGVLGQSLIRCATATENVHVFATYRSSPTNNDFDPLLVTPHTLDVADQEAVNGFFVRHPQILQFAQDRESPPPHSILINNAGVCVEGNTLSALQTSLAVNCRGPALLAEALINNYGQRQDRSCDGRLTIINVSSGEGELLFLHSDVQRDLQNIHSIEVCMPLQTYNG